MTRGFHPLTIPPRVWLAPGRPHGADLLVLRALRELGRTNLPSADMVYSSGSRTNG